MQDREDVLPVSQEKYNTLIISMLLMSQSFWAASTEVSAKNRLELKT